MSTCFFKCLLPVILCQLATALLASTTDAQELQFLSFVPAQLQEAVGEEAHKTDTFADRCGRSCPGKQALAPSGSISSAQDIAGLPANKQNRNAACTNYKAAFSVSGNHRKPVSWPIYIDGPWSTPCSPIQASRFASMQQINLLGYWAQPSSHRRARSSPCQSCLSWAPCKQK